MKDSRDIAGIGIPFAAGVAVGALLAACSSRIPLVIPFSLAGVLPALAVVIFLESDSSIANRIPVAALLFITGLFCSANSSIGSGIPLPQGPLARLASTSGGKLRELIDNIPYPTEKTGQLVKALLTGDRSGLDQDIKSVFRESGASHILALSGLHLGILYLILVRLTAPLGNSTRAKRSRYILTVAASGFYTIMTGASPSIVRAFLFITINETARHLGRKTSPVNTLLAALTIQLAIKPEVIATISFQLSYLAITGIAVLYPSLEKLYPTAKGLSGRLDPMLRIWRGAVLSISCQAFTAPLAWYRFHTFPKYFLLTNLTALPLTSAVVVLSVTTIALSSVGICPGFLVSLNDSVVQALITCLEIISSM